MTDEEIYHQAAMLDTTQQEVFLNKACGNDSDRFRRLKSMLSAAGKRNELLDTEAMASGTPAEPDVRRQIGDFQVGRLLGRGGMGEVYEAKQASLKRTVALKLLSSSLGLSSRAILRFRREAEAAGKLHHTNIVPIYTTGEENGVHFYAMELIDGPSLDKVIRELSDADQHSGSPRPASERGADRGGLHRNASLQKPANSSLSNRTTHFDEIATMFAEVADALDHAHEHGVIHRDIKPSNLLLGPDGRLSVNDFGLARMLEQPGMTMTGEFVGSPLYMSPEQIAAGRTPVDHRTDIYSLGATLYEMLTLQPPFPGDSRDQVLTGILHREAPSPRKINSKIPIDLDTIVLKAIEKDPDKRYQSAGKLAEDLRAYVNRHAISARRLGVIGRLIKYVRRNPVGVSFLCFVCAVCLIGLSLWHGARVRQRERFKTQVVDFAMRGQFDEARKRLEESGNSLSQGWRLLLEGQILLYEGESEIQANDALEKAARALPDDTAAKSLLAISYFLSGNEDEYIKLLREVYDSPANAFNDKLFKGYALYWFATKDAIELLDAAIEENRSYPLAHRFRGEALTVYALNMRERSKAKKHVDQSISDLLAARTLIGENLEINKLLTYAYLAKGIIHEGLGEKAEAESAFEQARTSAYANRDKWFSTEDTLYAPLGFHFVTDTESAFASMLLQNSVRVLNQGRPRQGYIEVKIPSFFFGQSKLSPQQRASTAVSVHEMVPSELRELTQYVPAFIATDAPDADRREILRRLKKDLPSRMRGHSGTYLLLDWVALRLLDAEESELDAVAQRIRDGYSDYFVSDHREWGIALADYMLRQIDETELKRRLHDSRSVATYAYLAIAANRIAEGERRTARAALQQSVDEGFFMYYAPKWSKAFLRRIDDPKWLPWFPPNSSPSDEAVVPSASGIGQQSSMPIVPVRE